MNTAQIKQMTDRFLSWKLPKGFSPDAGISFNPGHMAQTTPWWPTGTNLFSAEQAEDMVRHMLAGVGSNTAIETEHLDTVEEPGRPDYAEMCHIAQTNRDLAENLLLRLAESAAREGILRDTIRVNHEWHEQFDGSYDYGSGYSGDELRKANESALSLPDDNTALMIVLTNRGDIIERIRQFNTLAGNTDRVFNVRQTALYTGLQCEELAEKLGHIGYSVLSAELDLVGMDMKRGEVDHCFANIDRLAILDDDIDLAIVTLGSLLSQGADIHGAFSEVNRANMAKAWPDGTMHRDDNGKIIKPPAWTAPDLSPFICALTDEVPA